MTQADLEHLKAALEVNAVGIVSLASDIERLRVRIEESIAILQKITDRMG